MCNRCNYDSPDNRIYIDPLTNEYYLDIETSDGMNMTMDLFISENIFRIVLGVVENQENKHEDRIN